MVIKKLVFGLAIFFQLSTCLKQSLLMAQYVAGEEKTEIPKQTSKENSKGFWGRLVPGGNFGFLFGDQWYIDLSPSLGYQINDRFVAGAGAIYNAYGGKVNGVDFRYERYGGCLFARHQIYESLFANAEIELMNVPDERKLPSSRTWIFNPLAGGSYIVPIGNRGGFQISLLYNLNYQPYLSPYPSPLVWRVGVFL